MEEPGSSTTVAGETLTLHDVLNDELYAFCAETPQTNSAEVKELQRLKDKTKNINTTRTTSTWVNRFEEWRVARDLPHPLEKIEREELDGVLQLFYSAVKKENGENYEPGSLRTMIACLDRFLRDTKKPFSILQDKEFLESRK